MPFLITLVVLCLHSDPVHSSSLPWELGPGGPYVGLPCLWLPGGFGNGRPRGDQRDSEDRGWVFLLCSPSASAPPRRHVPKAAAAVRWPILCPPWAWPSLGSGSTNTSPHPRSPTVVTITAVRASPALLDSLNPGHTP